MQHSDLHNSILNTIKYFGLFKFPLTANEIHKYLYAPDQDYSYKQVLFAINKLVPQQLDCQEGFYFLKNSKFSAHQRKTNYLTAENKIRKAKKFIRLISWLPTIKAVFICNKLAYFNSSPDDDIDLLVIAKQNRIWLARFYSTLIMKILNRRPTAHDKKNKICLSFFISEDNLNLQSIALENDIYLVYWINQVLPIYDSANIYKDFYNANSWTKMYLPNRQPIELNSRWQISQKKHWQKPLQILCSPRIGNLLEKVCKQIQLKIMPTHLKQLAQEKNSSVIINDQMLKFHDKDKRREIKQKFFSLFQSKTRF